MDPNTNLSEQLRLAGRIADGISDAQGTLEQDARVLAELVLAMTHWIELGGCLPERWSSPSGPVKP